MFKYIQLSLLVHFRLAHKELSWLKGNVFTMKPYPLYCLFYQGFVGFFRAWWWASGKGEDLGKKSKDDFYIW